MQARLLHYPNNAILCIKGTPAKLIWVLATGAIIEEEPKRQLWKAPKIFHSETELWDRTLRCDGDTILVALPRTTLDNQTACTLASATPISATHLNNDEVWSHDIAITTGWINKEKPRDILEVGAGLGFYSRFLAVQTGHLVLCDPNIEALEHAADLVGWASPTTVLDTICCEGEALPFPNQFFDVIVSRMAMHHMNQPKIFIEEASRSLRPNGVLILVDLISPRDGKLRALTDSRERRIDPLHKSALTKDDLVTLLEQSDLTLEKIHITTLRTFLGSHLQRQHGSVETQSKIVEWILAQPADWKRAIELMQSDQDDISWRDDRFVLLARK